MIMPNMQCLSRRFLRTVRPPQVGVQVDFRPSQGALSEPGDTFVSMTGFAASALAAEPHAHFGTTAQAIADAARTLQT